MLPNPPWPSPHSSHLTKPKKRRRLSASAEETSEDNSPTRVSVDIWSCTCVCVCVCVCVCLCAWQCQWQVRWVSTWVGGWMVAAWRLSAWVNMSGDGWVNVRICWWVEWVSECLYVLSNGRVHVPFLNMGMRECRVVMMYEAATGRGKVGLSSHVCECGGAFMGSVWVIFTHVSHDHNSRYITLTHRFTTYCCLLIFTVCMYSQRTQSLTKFFTTYPGLVKFMGTKLLLYYNYTW